MILHSIQAGQSVVAPFDLGITHFDLANNYGPPPGAAEETFAKILRADFLAIVTNSLFPPRPDI